MENNEIVDEAREERSDRSLFRPPSIPKLDDFDSQIDPTRLVSEDNFKIQNDTFE